MSDIVRQARSDGADAEGGRFIDRHKAGLRALMSPAS